jgi:hypothetical protein
MKRILGLVALLVVLGACASDADRSTASTDDTVGLRKSSYDVRVAE